MGHQRPRDDEHDHEEGRELDRREAHGGHSCCSGGPPGGSGRARRAPAGRCSWWATASRWARVPTCARRSPAPRSRSTRSAAARAPAGVRVLADKLRADHEVIVFPLGTNDLSAASLAAEPERGRRSWRAGAAWWWPRSPAPTCAAPRRPSSTAWSRRSPSQSGAQVMDWRSAAGHHARRARARPHPRHRPGLRAARRACWPRRCRAACWAATSAGSPRRRNPNARDSRSARSEPDAGAAAGPSRRRARLPAAAADPGARRDERPHGRPVARAALDDAMRARRHDGARAGAGRSRVLRDRPRDGARPGARRARRAPAARSSRSSAIR